MAARAKPQTHMDEQALEAPELEELLERREDTLAGKRAYNVAHKAAKAVVDAKDLPVGLYRVGRFQIKMSQSEGGKEVSFTRNSAKTFRVKVAENGADDAGE